MISEYGRWPVHIWTNLMIKMQDNTSTKSFFGQGVGVFKWFLKFLDHYSLFFFGWWAPWTVLLFLGCVKAIDTNCIQMSPYPTWGCRPHVFHGRKGVESPSVFCHWGALTCMQRTHQNWTCIILINTYIIFILYYIILYCIILYYIILYHIILYIIYYIL